MTSTRRIQGSFVVTIVFVLLTIIICNDEKNTKTYSRWFGHPELSKKYPSETVYNNSYIERRVAHYMGSCWYSCAESLSCPAIECSKWVDVLEKSLNISWPLYESVFYFEWKKWAALKAPRGAVQPQYAPEFSLAVERSNLQNASFFVAFGDLHAEVRGLPYMQKTRLIHRNTSCNDPILFKMNRGRHFTPLVTMNTIKETMLPFKERADIAVWRGVTTGLPSIDYRSSIEDDLTFRRIVHPRAALVKRIPLWKNCAVLDIAVTRYVQGIKDEWGTAPAISMSDLTKNKMIIIVEGNDVASGLKWALHSGSAVVMPLPSKESWAMESLLVPWVHFIPVLPDFSDLVENVEWCIKNVEDCMAIADRGSRFMHQFLDQKLEQILETRVLEKLWNIMKYVSNTEEIVDCTN